MLLPAIALTAFLLPLQSPPAQPPPVQPPLGKRAPTASEKKSVNPNDADAAVIKDFVKRVDDYVSLHKKLEGTLPALPKQTTPQNIDEHERALAKLIQASRKGAKQGEIFALPMQQLVRRHLRPIFAGTEGAHIRTEIIDNESSKANVTLAVNGRYPDEIPVSTVPPQVLTFLPKLPEELEYRFVRQNLILFDPHAHIIPDWVSQAFK